MKIGIFDSGLGGLLIAKSIRKKMPEYDYVYLGDTKRVPYGNRSHDAVYQFTKEGVEYLFKKENCGLIILACNTASARALRKIQQEYLPANFPDRKVLGVLIPTAEEVFNFKKIGILATSGTVSSGTFIEEIKKMQKMENMKLKINKADKKNKIKKIKSKIYQNSAPMLVPLAEEGETDQAFIFIKKYLKPLLSKKIDALILGCTHYPLFKKDFKKMTNILNKYKVADSGFNNSIKIISQDEIIPKKLKNYLKNHPKIEKNISKKGQAKILVTDITKNVEKLSKKWFGKNTKPELVNL